MVKNQLVEVQCRQDGCDAGLLVSVGIKDLYFVNLSINIDCLHLNTKKTSVELIQSAEKLREVDGSNKEIESGLIKRRMF